jgi:hypothetical protein
MILCQTSSSKVIENWVQHAGAVTRRNCCRRASSCFRVISLQDIFCGYVPKVIFDMWVSVSLVAAALREDVIERSITVLWTMKLGTADCTLTFERVMGRQKATRIM